MSLLSSSSCCTKSVRYLNERDLLPVEPHGPLVALAALGMLQPGALVFLQAVDP